MVEIKTLASGSTGNAYRITDGETPLLVECGIPIKQIKKGLAFGLSKIRGCLCSHAHQDHAKAIKDVMKAGINCYTSRGTANSLRLSGHRLKIIEAEKQFRVGTWAIKPFPTMHDAPEPLGFLMASGQEKLLFVTDSALVEPLFRGLTHIMIECNYCADILDENTRKGVIARSMKDRLLFTHFSLGNVLKFLEANDLSKVFEIHLLHISVRNGNPEKMKNAVAALTGIPVYVTGYNEKL